jgi:hypothetical protein
MGLWVFLERERERERERDTHMGVENSLVTTKAFVR